MTKELAQILESIDTTIAMWRQGRKLGDETIIELLYLQSRILIKIMASLEESGLTRHQETKDS
jgi:hypothetical protein